jgi:hypothetical protein
MIRDSNKTSQTVDGSHPDLFYEKCAFHQPKPQNLTPESETATKRQQQQQQQITDANARSASSILQPMLMLLMIFIVTDIHSSRF